MAITRTADTDDDGTGNTGTIRNAAWKTEIYDQIDDAIDGADAAVRSVALGGTGRATATAYAVLTGGTTATGAHQSIASVGTSGQVLTSNGAGAKPTFQTPASGVAGSDTQVMFNDTGALAGDTGLTYNKTTDALTVGSLVATLGQIKFPATQSASSDANTLDDYEEGTWTPSDGSGAGLSFTSVSAAYVKIGQLVVAGFELVYPSTASGTAAKIGGLPFATFGTPSNGWTGVVGYTDSSIDFRFLALGTNLFPYKTDGVQPTNANLSLKSVRGMAVYRASA